MDCTKEAARSAAIALALAIGFAGQLHAEEPAGQKPAMDTNVMKCCQAMKTLKTKMHEAMKAQDVELSKQLAAMNSAPQEKKITLVAAVISLIVEQRIVMRKQRAQLDEEMAKHMMEHINMRSMLQHPMMDMKNAQKTNNIVDGTRSDN